MTDLAFIVTIAALLAALGTAVQFVTIGFVPWWAVLIVGVVLI